MTEPTIKSRINGIAADYLNINDRAIHYGDGIFETILCSNNSLLFWQQHYQRLKISADKLQLKCPGDKILLGDIAQLLEATPHASEKIFSVKIILTRGKGDRGYRFKRDRFNQPCDSTRLVFLSEIAAEYSSLVTGVLSSGVLCQCQQQASINEDLAGLKHLNRLENVIARNEWDDQYIDGVMINANKQVIECSTSNIFAVKKSRLFTPDLKQSGVKGIMRDAVMILAEKINIPVSVTHISIEELKEMDELFITNSLIGMNSVTKLCDAVYPENTVTSMIFNALLKQKEAHVQTV